MGNRQSKGGSAPRAREPVPVQDQRELCYDSMGSCGKPGCHNPLNIRTARTGAITTVGEKAHIIAAQDNGPRGDPLFPPDKRERYENLILLCRFCHAVVDNPANFTEYTKEVLRDWKTRQHKLRLAAVARSRLQPEITELGDLLDGLATATPTFGDTFERIDISKKIEVNGLSETVAATIARNVIHADMVSRQILLVERMRPNYGEMIKTRMLAEWLAINDQGFEGDVAYDRLKDSLMFSEGKIGSEGVVDIVLAYFFELCTILHRADPAPLE